MNEGIINTWDNNTGNWASNNDCTERRGRPDCPQQAGAQLGGVGGNAEAPVVVQVLRG